MASIFALLKNKQQRTAERQIKSKKKYLAEPMMMNAFVNQRGMTVAQAHQNPEIAQRIEKIKKRGPRRRDMSGNIIPSWGSVGAAVNGALRKYR